MSTRKYGASSFKRPMTGEKEMSEVERFEIEVTGSNQYRHVKVPFGGSYVNYRDYAALKAERDALAAENVAMLHLLTEVSENHVESQTESEDAIAVIDLDCISEVNTFISRDVNGDNPFTATDVYANQLRAEGAASVGTLIRASAYEFPGSAKDIVEECAMIADNRAANLRKENGND